MFLRRRLLSAGEGLQSLFYGRSLPGELEEAHNREHLFDRRIEVCENELSVNLLQLLDDFDEERHADRVDNSRLCEVDDDFFCPFGEILVEFPGNCLPADVVYIA